MLDECCLFCNRKWSLHEESQRPVKFPKFIPGKCKHPKVKCALCALHGLDPEAEHPLHPTLYCPRIKRSRRVQIIGIRPGQAAERIETVKQAPPPSPQEVPSAWPRLPANTTSVVKAQSDNNVSVIISERESKLEAQVAELTEKFESQQATIHSLTEQVAAMTNLFAKQIAKQKSDMGQILAAISEIRVPLNKRDSPPSPAVASSPAAVNAPKKQRILATVKPSSSKSLINAFDATSSANSFAILQRENDAKSPETNVAGAASSAAKEVAEVKQPDVEIDVSMKENSEFET
jgi:hypothetical protein